MMTLPWVTAPGAALLAMYTSELTVHTLDLAKATGQQPAWREPSRAGGARRRVAGVGPGDRGTGFEAMAANLPVLPLANFPPFKNAGRTSPRAHR